MGSNLAYIVEAMSMSVARFVRYGTTMDGPGGVIVSARTKGDALVDL